MLIRIRLKLNSPVNQNPIRGIFFLLQANVSFSLCDRYNYTYYKADKVGIENDKSTLQQSK